MKIKRVVITGGPATGKTSIINELYNRGYTCIEEISRQITLKARESGIEQLFLTNPLAFSEQLLEGRTKQFLNTKTINKPLLFYDRGIPDVLAYLEYAQTSYPISFIDACKSHQYDAVFILKPWEAIFESDNERYENFIQAQYIYDNLVTTYEKYGYILIDVPFDTVERRTDYILNYLNAN